MNGALGLIETQGLVGLITAIDAMLKAANVELASSIIKLDGGLVERDGQGRRQQRPRRGRGGRRGGRSHRRAQGRPRHRQAGPGHRLGVRRGWALKILVANLGSTSFKYRLYDLGDPAEPLMARVGRAHRLGGCEGHDPLAPPRDRAGRARPRPRRGGADLPRPAHRPRFRRDPGRLGSRRDRLQGGLGPRPVRRRRVVNEVVLQRMEDHNEAAPAHNPPYVKAMRASTPASPACPWSPPSRPASTRRSPKPRDATPSPRSGRPSTGSSATDSMAPATVSSPAAPPSCSARPTRKSSRATWAAARPCARSGPVSRSVAAWG